MKTKPKFTFLFQKQAADFHARCAAYHAKVRKMTKAQKRAHLIELGTLNPDGTLRRYPMDHVPLGPRN